MDEFKSNDVCEILKIKPHILRYWEQQITLLKPQKNNSGQRIYSSSDLQVLLHFKHLVYQKMYTIEGAVRVLLEEEIDDPMHGKQEVRNVRKHLLRLLGKVIYLQKETDTLKSDQSDQDEHG